MNNTTTPARTPTVLFVEDDAGLRMCLKAWLKKRTGIEALVAPNAVEGFKLYLKHKPDLVCTDGEMPVLPYDDTGIGESLAAYKDVIEHYMPMLDGSDNNRLSDGERLMKAIQDYAESKELSQPGKVVFTANRTILERMAQNSVMNGAFHKDLGMAKFIPELVSLLRKQNPEWAQTLDKGQSPGVG